MLPVLLVMYSQGVLNHVDKVVVESYRFSKIYIIFSIISKVEETLNLIFR